MDKKKDARIKSEIDRLTNIFKDISTNEKGTVVKLIDNVAFLSITLEDLMKYINQNPLIVETKNASQSFQKENPAITAYNKTYANFIKGIQQLLSLLPERPVKNKDEQQQDELLEFLNKKKRK